MTDQRSVSTGRPAVGMYSFKTADPIRLATFWGGLMGLPVADGASEQLAMLDFDHEHSPVTWLFERTTRTSEADGRLSLDIHNDADWRGVADRAEQLGATRDGEREQDGARWIEMRDPDGNPFRVFAPRPQ
jgi:glyoxalase superfamily protein